MSDASSFWTRRRAAVQAEAEADTRAALQAEQEARADAQAEKDDATVLAEMGLPDPDAMQQGDDFSAFMSREVPEHLRRQALRTLWRSNPVLACVDGLNEYDDDYRAAMLLQEPIKTAYQVGKGMTAHVEEMERQAKAAEEAAEIAENQEDDTSEAPEDISSEAAETPENTAVIEVLACEAQTKPEETGLDDAVPAPRRMRFRFDEAAV